MGLPRKFTPDQRHEIWERIGAGESTASIARSMERYPSAVLECLGTRGDLAGSGCGRLTAHHRPAAGPGAVERLARGGSQRWPLPLPGPARGSTGLSLRSSAQGRQTLMPSKIA